MQLSPPNSSMTLVSSRLISREIPAANLISAAG